MALERATQIAAYANLVEQAILDPRGAGASCSPYEQELLTSRGLLSSFKIVAPPVNELLEANTTLSPPLRITPSADGTPASNGRQGSSIVAEYSPVTLEQERPVESTDGHPLGGETNSISAYDATFGIGAIHSMIGGPQDEDAGGDDIQLDQYEVIEVKVSLAAEEQKRLAVPVHDEADRKDSKRALSHMDLLSWDYCSDMAWLLLQPGRND